MRDLGAATVLSGKLVGARPAWVAEPGWFPTATTFSLVLASLWIAGGFYVAHLDIFFLFHFVSSLVADLLQKL